MAVDAELGVVGFYSLGAFSLDLADLPADVAHRLPRYEAIPAALIGRLARDERVRGTGVGELLLADAVRRTLDASRSVAMFAILVDAKDDRAAAFYADFGFQPFPTRPGRMFLLAQSAAEGFARSFGP
ncbi:MAG TPA: N-acetyltransferase [Caulobacteraceae bacterium]|nr:N-acetyltransferase [Caulobacteraceae bacterium]